jgi:diguanylate cyclase (GGDEF)-like protein
MTPRALNVAMVSPDRATLRSLSWLLTAFGYKTAASVELESVLGGLTDHWDMLILDADLPQLSLNKSPLLRRPEGRYIYTLLMCDPRKMPNVTDALEWGVDDLLQKPISNGEVLARLRAGARFLEFERRLGEQATRDELTNLLTQSGLLAAMRKAADAGARDTTCALVVVDLDHFRQVDQRHGRKRADEILISVASALAGLATGNSRAARLSEDRFALFVPGGKPGSGADVSEEVREAVVNLPLKIGSEGVHLTVSVGYVEFDARTDVPLEVLDRASEALAHAKSSGRDCVVRAGEFDEQFAEWRREVNTGNPFVTVTAKDVMQPFGFLLRPDVDFRRACGQLLKSSLEYFAVIDNNRSLVGTIHRDELVTKAPGQAEQVATDSRLPLHKPYAVPEETPFGDLVERFTTEDDPLVVVVRDREPRGYITREGFLNLIEPVYTNSYRPSTPFSSSANYLVVPEFMQLEEAEA